MVQNIKTSDDRLLLALRSAEMVQRDRALAYIYEQHYDVIASFILKNNGSTIDAEDIFQEAMIVFYKKIQDNELELTCSIRTYLYAICRNLWLKQLSRRNRKQELIGEWDDVVAMEEPLHMIEEEQRAALAAILDQMGEGCRKLLVHYFYDRMRMKDIAEVMNLANEGVVKNKKLRCMKKLQELVLKSPAYKAIFRKD
ncbi:MAG: sigma-70 family RNA polymerase sigma factor [Bacteroidota bacterium]